MRLTTGSVLLGVSHTISMILADARVEASATSESYHQVPFRPGWLHAPIIGPWIALATAKTHDCRNSYYASSYFYGQCNEANRDLDTWRAGPGG